MRIGFDAHVLDGRAQGIKTLMVRLIGEAVAQFPEHDYFVYCEAEHPELDFSRPNLNFRKTKYRGAFQHLMLDLPRLRKTDSLDTMVFNFISSPLMKNATVLIHDVLAQTHSRFFSPIFVLRCWFFYGLAAFTAGHIGTISDYSRAQIRRIYPWARSKTISVLHIGPSFSAETYFEQAKPPAEVLALGRYAMCVGRIEPRKNVQLAIDAFRKGAPSDAKLLIIGNREPGIKIDLFDDDRITEMHGLSDAALIDLYRGADLFLYPSVGEGFGLPLLDAILFGVPTISSSLTAMAEVGGECVTFFDPESLGPTETAADLIRGHFNGARIPAPTLEQRRERFTAYSWQKASQELLACVQS